MTSTPGVAIGTTLTPDADQVVTAAADATDDPEVEASAADRVMARKQFWPTYQERIYCAYILGNPHSVYSSTHSCSEAV